MFSRSLFHQRQFTLTRLVALCALLLIIALVAFKAAAPHSHAAARPQLTFEDRVAAQRAIEEVYWRHRIWPTDNPEPKPPLDQVLPEAALRTKVEDYLRLSSALEVYWQRPVTAADLQAEVERMARDTRQPDVLGELWAALGNDPTLIAECLARPLLVERMAREEYEKAEGGRRKAEAKADSLPLSSRSLPPFDEWWSGVRAQMEMEMEMEMATAADGEYLLPEIAAVAVPCGADAWTATSTTGAPRERVSYTAVWTGSEMIIWGGGTGGFGAINTGGRYNPATDSWTATNITGAPSARSSHTAVWTGSEMIIWGGDGNSSTGGRYNPATNSWIATTITGASNIAYGPTAVWTGSEMIVWGGSDGFGNPRNTGGRYSPAADSWTITTTTGAPNARFGHTAVWTGSEMIVWGGRTGNSDANTGGRYNPATNSWAATSASSAPTAREFHTAIWTGSEMIVWGGINVGGLNTGGRYNPVTNSWTTTSTTGAPTGRAGSAVWTGSEMIVWGGANSSSVFNTGGRYNPAIDSWIATTTTGAPSVRAGHTAVWTSSEMIVWGGSDSGNLLSTGGRYSIAAPLTISQTTQSFPTTGGGSSFIVTGLGNCTWTATTNANWLTITLGSSGAGTSSVVFTVAANTLGPRTGLITINSFIHCHQETSTLPL